MQNLQGAQERETGADGQRALPVAGDGSGPAEEQGVGGFVRAREANPGQGDALGHGETARHQKSLQRSRASSTN